MDRDGTLKKKLNTNRDKYIEYLRGKRVVIVGPAPTIVGSQQKDLINSFDVVVRLNKAVPMPETLLADIGTRTDVLYNCMNPSEECGGQLNVKDLRKHGVKFLVSPYAPIITTDKRYIRFKTDIYNYLTHNPVDDLSISHIDPVYFKQLLKIMKLPNTGVNAILDLLAADISELYITGFTFFKGGYYKEYRRYNEKEVLERMDKYGLHDQEKQMIHMKEVLLNDNRVKMDKNLMEIVMEYKPESTKTVKNISINTNMNSKTEITTEKEMKISDEPSKSVKDTKINIKKFCNNI
jgi:hypothetical protein